MTTLNLETIGSFGNLDAVLESVRAELPSISSFDQEKLAVQLLGSYHIAAALNRVASAIEGAAHHDPLSSDR